MGASRYRELGPRVLPAPWRDLLECAWRTEVAAGAASHEQRVLPDGCMDLLLLDGRIVVAGPDTTAHLAPSAPGSTITGLRFRPGALPALLGVAADEVRDRRVDLDDVLAALRPGIPPVVTGRTAEMALSVARGPVQDAHAHLVGAGPTGLAVLLDAATALRDASERDRPRLPGPLPDPALRALGAGMPAAELAERLGVTTRTLHRRCLATLGYGPSVARRVLRFRAAAGLLHAGIAPAEAAVRAGYADQPHLSREVRALAGVTPAGLAAPARPAQA